MSINKAIILGNVGKDPEIRYTASGIAVASLTIATSYKSKGEETTEWHRVTLWDKQATLAEQYIKKGDKLYVEGRIETRKWTDKDGNDKYTTEIVGERIDLLSPKRDGVAPASKPAASKPAKGGFDAMDDDVPF